MDVLEKNMVVSTTHTLLNYGGFDKNTYTLVGQVSSDSPFTLTIVADNITIPFGYDIIQTSPYTMSFNSMQNLNVSDIDSCSSFILQFDTPNQKEINLKLWKPYPISPFT